MPNHRAARVRAWGLVPGVARALTAAVAVALSPSVALTQGAPDARSIVETVLEKRAERLEGVQNYTMVQTLNGAEATLYMERVAVDGVPAFRIVPPDEYQGEALEKAGLGGSPAGMGAAGGAAGVPGPAGGLPGGIPAPADALPGAVPGVPGTGGAAGALPPLLEGLPLPGGLTLPEGVPLPGGLSLPGGLPAGVPGMPGAGGVAGGGPGGALQGAAGAVLGGAAGGLQQQLAQKGMEGLMGLARSGSQDAGEEEAILPLRGLEDLAETARLEGTEVVDGAECYVLRTDRIQDPELARQMGGGADFTLRVLTVWIDTQEFVSRRTVATGEIAVQGQPQEMTIEVLEQDYRHVDGMLEAFRRVVRVTGMGAILAAEDPGKAEQITKDMQENLAKLKEMEEMLARLPPEQRRMAEAQMGGAIAQMKQLAEGNDWSAPMVTEVKELRVNAGPPTPFGAGEVAVQGGDAALELPAMIAHATPAADETGRVAGWVIQLMGAVGGEAGGVVQIAVTGDLPSSGRVSGNGGASFRWEDGRELQLVAPEGGAGLTMTSRDATRMAGEFSFEATGQLVRADGVTETRALVRGRFQVPVPPASPGLPPGLPGGSSGT